MNAIYFLIETLYTYVVKKSFKKVLLLLIPALSSFYGYTQCAAGYNQVTLNWNYLDYLIYTGNYTSGNGYLSSIAEARSQNFAFGTQRLNIVAGNTYIASEIIGENTTHTGEAGSFGTGADVEFRNDGIITLTFEQEVSNLRFSIYDLDNSQSATVTAQNAAATAQNVTMTKTNAASAIVIIGSGTTSANATSLLVGNQGNASTLASLNIDIAGPVSTVSINIGSAGDFWISGISACSPGNFPTNYYAVSQPFTGQPGYVLHAFDKSVYAVNPVNGVTKLLFNDATGAGSINSMAYDPYNKILYYVYSLTASPSTNRTLKKYDFNTEAISTVLANVNTIGIPTTTYAGVESGAGAFYNGSWYLGIETSNTNKDSNRETVIWRIDFDASNIPYRASQVFALPVDNGSELIHDWADFVIHDGILYDFDGAGVTTQTDIYQFNLLTGACTNYPLPAGFTPGQPCVGWAGNLYQTYAYNPAGTASDIAPYIALYNGNGTIGPVVNMSSTPAITFPNPPSLGDAAEAFKPKSDFGDAPASYTPAGIEPATHERISTLMLGSTFDHEWTGSSSLMADADGADEDGIGAAPALNYSAVINYSLNVNVLNNTGSNATLIGWLDYNFNGLFDAGEGVSVNVTPSASSQVKALAWNSINVPMTALTHTFIRFRLTSAANGMTTSNMNGYFPDGEVEDFTVVLGAMLPKDILSFKAEKTSGSAVDVLWSMVPASPVKNIEILRSADSKKWEPIGTMKSKDVSSISEYKFTDDNPLKGTSYYRILVNYENSSNKYSSVHAVNIENKNGLVKLSPNPAIDRTQIKYTAKKVLKCLYNYWMTEAVLLKV